MFMPYMCIGCCADDEIENEVRKWIVSHNFPDYIDEVMGGFNNHPDNIRVAAEYERDLEQVRISMRRQKSEKVKKQNFSEKVIKQLSLRVSVN